MSDTPEKLRIAIVGPSPELNKTVTESFKSQGFIPFLPDEHLDELREQFDVDSPEELAQNFFNLAYVLGKLINPRKVGELISNLNEEKTIVPGPGNEGIRNKIIGGILRSVAKVRYVAVSNGSSTDASEDSLDERGQQLGWLHAHSDYTVDGTQSLEDIRFEVEQISANLALQAQGLGIAGDSEG